MKYTFYGTAAAEGIPAIFCECEACNRARKLGGKNIMTRSQSVIDGVLGIDFSADSYLHVINYGMPERDISSYLITHNHMDHFYQVLCLAQQQHHFYISHHHLLDHDTEIQLNKRADYLQIYYHFRSIYFQIEHLQTDPLLFHIQ